jgi:C4-dicarboxylate-specific signal transduction histidine kinase
MFEFFPERFEAGPPTYERHVSTIHEDDQALFKGTIEQALLDGKPYQFRYRCIKEGRLRWLEGRGRSVFDGEGKRVGLRGTCQDITEQVELAHSLDLARQQAVQTAKFASLGEMAGGVAHEINNPLTILKGRAQQIADLLKGSENSSIEDAREAAQSLQRNIDRIARIVRGMRSFSRDGGADPLRDELLNTVVEDTLELCRERFHHHGVLLEVDLAPDIHACCRATEISQVIMNLLNNSFDAVQGQPVRVVKLALTSNGTHARLAVTDSGPGVPTELESRIMEPFFTTKGVGHGTGLGLSVARGIAQMHGARLFYERHAGKGACFVFEIPLLGIIPSSLCNSA